MKLRALIVDDEELARDRLRDLLAECDDVTVVSEAATGREAVALIRRHAPDLVFLDVQMPEGSGFDVLNALGDDRPVAVVFVTAYDEHAVRAFEVSALDYLLKPFKPERLAEALDRARRQIEQHLLRRTQRDWFAALRQAAGGPSSHQPDRIMVRSADRICFLKWTELDYLEAAGNYVVLHRGRENHLIRESLSHVEQQLPPHGFLRISRSIIVNCERIRELRLGAGGEYLVILADGTKLTTTRALKEIQAQLRSA